MAKPIKMADTVKYGGQYVCADNEGNVISSSVDPLEALKEAKEKGFEDPLIFYVPRAGERFCYPAASL